MYLIAFICRGNTCRSPLAAALAGRALFQAGLDAYIGVASAGVAVDRAGAPADPRAVKVAGRHGLVLAGHAATPLTPDLVRRSHLLIGLDSRTRDDIVQRFGVDADRAPLLMSFARDHDVIDVADPYYGTDDDYARAFDLISAGVDGLIEHLAGSHARS